MSLSEAPPVAPAFDKAALQELAMKVPRGAVSCS